MYTTAPLLGRFHSPLHHARAELRRQPLHHLETVCASRIDPALLEPNATGENSRERIFTPRLTFFAFLDQVLHPEASCRSALDQILTYYQSLPSYPSITPDTSAYCQARARWSEAELIAIRRDLAQRPALHGDTLLPGIPGGRALKVVDGTTFNLPDTPKNQAAYPQTREQKPGCGFPLVRLVGLFDLKTGCLLEERSAPYTTSENALFKALWPTLCPGDILVGDRNFCAYATLATLTREHQCDVLLGLHIGRRVDFRKGRRLGPRDRLITWTKPAHRTAHCSPEQWAQLPATLDVRLIRSRLGTTRSRCRTITLATTLTDPKLWPVKLLAALYGRRWDIELFWDDLKTVLDMDLLSCRTPTMAQKELQMHFIAYNLIRCLMAETALTCHVALPRISFTGTRDALHHYSQAIAKIPARDHRRRRRLYAEMLATLAADLVPERPDRREPRCQKRRPKAYPFLTQPRHQMKDRPKSYRRKKTTPNP